ncbi:heme-binding protein [Haloplanus aerogenes]|uniref:Chlorite dismutase n=1 Tax=Haloplanus aerogenes TaxID=660522 RepID=A0A3M0DYF7_9EURY|nr:heme-binding protein [Haloplanus aerogenes]AZH24174.1 heme-binding protein [Haloplanus aerogenes]RMB24206.1 chlorite dismutase [Haloplanus aerogenes]
MREPPQTDEGWYVLHDFRRIDWAAWRDAPKRERDRAVEEGVEYLETHEAVADADDGASAVFAMVGHKADLLIVHLRPTLDALSTAERRFDRTALGAFTEQSTSYVSVTEVSGYVSDAYFAEDEEEVDQGLKRYIEGKLEPDIPADQYISFYPMSRKRGEQDNWYDLPFERRREMMKEHGEHGREFGGRVKQIVASSVGLDDWEWGVTLFSEDPTDLKDIVYEMRYDEASARYSEFGPFYVGRRFPPSDLPAFLAGETVPTGEDDGEGHAHAHGEGGHHGEGDGHDHGDAHGDDDTDEDGIRGKLEDLNIYAGKPHGEDVYATVLYSEADADDLFEEVDGLRSNFDHYDTHVKTAVYDALERDRRAVVSIWDTASAADTAAGFLSELPGIVSRAGEESGFGTMGMFYTVKPEHRDDFVEKFETVGGLLADMEGHGETDLMINREDENDMFIASQWRSREDAMNFFRSDEFSDTVSWGRDVLADRPRHVFLA